MKLFFLLASLAFGAAPQPSLEQLGLTSAVVEAAGYKDSFAGLLEVKTAVVHSGEARRAILERIKKEGAAAPSPGGAAKAKAKLQGGPVVLDSSAIDPFATELQAQFFDQTAKKSAQPAVSVTAPPRRQRQVLQAAASPKRKTDVPLPAAPGTAVTVGVSARGSLPRLVSLVSGAMGLLPAKGAAGLAEDLALRVSGRAPDGGDAPGACQTATQLCLNSLLRAYYGRLPKSDPAWSWAQETVVGSFRQGLGEKVAAKVQISEDLKLLKNRGLWAANPVLANPDGSWTLVLNGRVLEQMSRKEYALRQSIEELDDAARARLIETALEGQSPLIVGGDLPYRLLGWMQAEALKDVRKAMAAGASAAQAQELAMANIMADPVRRKLQDEATKIISDQMRWKKHALVAAVPAQPMWRFSLESLQAWDLLKAANAGDKDALKDYLDLAKRDADPLHLEARKVLPYLNLQNHDLQNPEIRREVEAALPDLADPGVVRRLAAQGSEKAISALARDYGAPEFMEGFLLQASRNPAFQGEYRDMVAALSKSPGRTLAEVLARQGAFWEKLARLGPFGPACALVALGL